MNHYYVHIPFCHRVCPYCKFAVSPVVNELTRKRYLEYLKKEIKSFFQDHKQWNGDFGNSPLIKGDVTKGQGDLVSEKIPPAPFIKGGRNTIYFGGGTPSILSIEELREILECFSFLDSPPSRGSERGYNQDTPPNLPYKGRNEITLESNPEDVTEEKVRGWKMLGINRISIGVQSLNNRVLEAIHRSNSDTIFRALKIIQSCIGNLESGISINIDLILGLPYSKPEDTLKAIRELHERFPNVTHTSVYILEDERYPQEWKNHYPTTEEVQIEYMQICKYLEERGWHHYEISNWAKPGYESTHNQSYWNHSDYLGFGLSAGSFQSSFGKELSQSDGGFSGSRLSNASNFRDYFAGKQDKEILTDEQIRIEKVMFGLRTFSLDEHLIKNKAKLEEFIQDGLLGRDNSKLFPTKTGIFMLDYIMSELV